MGLKALVALDTDHVKRYVFASDRLKEIRGASSVLDRFNRNTMEKLALEADQQAWRVYANGGSGLFVIEESKVEEFIAKVQKQCREDTGGTGSVTCVSQALPHDAPTTKEELQTYELLEILDLLRHRLRIAKNESPALLALTSHPLLSLCQACGVEYAVGKDEGSADEADNDEARYCKSCLIKRIEDVDVIKKFIDGKIQDLLGFSTKSAPAEHENSPLWDCLLKLLHDRGYDFAPDGKQHAKRPRDFNVFQGRAKNYIGLIYADGNGMGQKVSQIRTLGEMKTFADTVDQALYEAVAQAITEHLKISTFNLTNPDGSPAFPFDILMLGGDDLLIVTPASVALQVAKSIATHFYEYANRITDPPAVQTLAEVSKNYSLSVGVILAPNKYPFSSQLELAEETLKFAKKAGSSRTSSRPGKHGNTLINFLVIPGSVNQGFKRAYSDLVARTEDNDTASFYATLRPYNTEQLDLLLNLIKEGNQKGLGRTKLHQLREAVLQKNLTTAVSNSLAILVSWQPAQRDMVVRYVYAIADDYQKQYASEAVPTSNLPSVVFPWFRDGLEDGKARYRSVLIDLVDLYDFVDREESPESGAKQN